MRYVAAYLLATLANKDSPSSDDLKSIISSVGIDFDDKQAKMVLKNLKGKSVEELLAEGSSRLASMPSGGAAPAAAAAAGEAAPAGGNEAAKKEEKKEESEESDDDMGFGLFD